MWQKKAGRERYREKERARGAERGRDQNRKREWHRAEERGSGEAMASVPCCRSGAEEEAVITGQERIAAGWNRSDSRQH